MYVEKKREIKDQESVGSAGEAHISKISPKAYAEMVRWQEIQDEKYKKRPGSCPNFFGHP